MEINIGEMLKSIVKLDPEVAFTDRTVPVMAALIVTVVISVLTCFFGLKLIRIWNILIGLLAGAALGFSISGAFNLEDMTRIIITLGAAVFLAVLGGIFKKFGVFIYTLASIFATAVVIIKPNNWILLAVCGGIGLLVAIIAMIVFEPLVIIVTSINGGVGVGTAVTSLIGFSNVYITYAIIIVVVLLGIAIQFSTRYREISKKEVRHAEEIKDEISKAQQVEHLRTLLDDDEE